jgi:hypothetical protein
MTSRAHAFEPPDQPSAMGDVTDRHVVEYILASDAEIVKLHAAGKPVPKVSYTVGRLK